MGLRRSYEVPVRSSVAIVSLYNFVNPVIAVGLGTLVLGEPFHARMLLAAAIIVVGILIVRKTAMGARNRLWKLRRARRP